MAAESINTVPSGRISAGTRPRGLVARIDWKSANTERASCSKAKPSSPSDTATRRVYGESYWPTRIMGRSCALPAMEETHGPAARHPTDQQRAGRFDHALLAGSLDRDQARPSLDQGPVGRRR